MTFLVTPNLNLRFFKLKKMELLQNQVRLDGGLESDLTKPNLDEDVQLMVISIIEKPVYLLLHMVHIIISVEIFILHNLVLHLFFKNILGSTMSVWTTSLVNTQEVINMLLDKYRVECPASNFSLFVVKDNGGKKNDSYLTLMTGFLFI